MIPQRTWRRAVVASLLASSPVCAQTRSAPAGQEQSRGVRIQSVNSFPQLEVDGVPFFVHAASFPYFRLPADLWARSIEEYGRMGINTIDLAIPWNWHAVNAEEFDFAGQTNPRRDLRRLLRIVAEKEMKLIVRPAASIEGWKNGGLPDWLLGAEETRLRSDLAKFLEKVAAEIRISSPENAIRIPDRESRKENAEKSVSGALILVAAPSAAAAETLRAAGVNVPLFFQDAATDGKPQPVAGRVNWVGPAPRRTDPQMPVAAAVGAAEAWRIEEAASRLATQTTLPPFFGSVSMGASTPPDDIQPPESALSDAFLRSRILFGHGIGGLSYQAVQDSLAPAGFVAANANRFVRVDAALDINASRQPAARNVLRNGQLLEHWGAFLASSHKRSDLAVVAPAGFAAGAKQWRQFARAAHLADLSLAAADPALQNADRLLQSPLLVWNTNLSGTLAESTQAAIVDYVKHGGSLVVFPRRPEGTALELLWASRESAPGQRNFGEGKILEVGEDPFEAIPTEETLSETRTNPVTQAAQQTLLAWIKFAQTYPIFARPKSTGAPLQIAEIVSHAGARPLGERARQGGQALLSVTNLGSDTVEEEVEVLSPRLGTRAAGDGRLRLAIAIPPHESFLLPLHASLCSAAEKNPCEDEIIFAGAEFLRAEREGKNLELTFYAPVRAVLRLRLEKQPLRVRTDEMSVDGIWTVATRQFEFAIPRGPAPGYLRVVRIQLPYEPHVPVKPDPEKTGRRDYDFSVSGAVRLPLARDAALETYPPLVVLKGDHTGRMMMQGQNYDLMGRGIEIKITGPIKGQDEINLDPGELGFERVDLKPDNGNSSAEARFLEGQIEAKSGRDRRTLPVAFVSVDKEHPAKYQFDFDRDGALEWTLEDEHLRVVASPENGGRIVALVDKESGLNLTTSLGLLRDIIADTTPDAAPPQDTGNHTYKAEWVSEGEKAALRLISPTYDGLTIEKRMHIADQQAIEVNYLWRGAGLQGRTLSTALSLPVTLHGDNTTRFCWEKPLAEGAPAKTPAQTDDPPERQCEMFDPQGKPVTVPEGITHLEVRTPGSSALRIEWLQGQMRVEMKNFSARLQFDFPRVQPGATEGQGLLRFRAVVVE